MKKNPKMTGFELAQYLEPTTLTALLTDLQKWPDDVALGFVEDIKSAIHICKLDKTDAELMHP